MICFVLKFIFLNKHFKKMVFKFMFNAANNRNNTKKNTTVIQEKKK